MRYKFDDFGFIGFDLWQVKGNTIFDNVIITDTWLQVFVGQVFEQQRQKQATLGWSTH